MIEISIVYWILVAYVLLHLFMSVLTIESGWGLRQFMVFAAGMLVRAFLVLVAILVWLLYHGRP